LKRLLQTRIGAAGAEDASAICMSWQGGLPGTIFLLDSL
jgi:hypothetical protein